MKHLRAQIGSQAFSLPSEINNNVLLIDVREPEEFSAFHLPGSINIPLASIRLGEFEKFASQKICLICNTGARAKAVAKKLDLLGFNNVSVAKRHLKHLNPNAFLMQNIENKKHVRWSVDRQFRLTLGVLLAFYLVLTYYGVTVSIIVPIVLATGLIVTSLIDRCYMRMAIGKLPWNR